MISCDEFLEVPSNQIPVYDGREGGGGMLRGARKNMIVVRTRDSRVFEEAYFVMRRDCGLKAVDEADMLWEANRILESALPAAGKKHLSSPVESARRRWQGLLWFGAGLLIGGGVTGLLWFLL